VQYTKSHLTPLEIQWVLDHAFGAPSEVSGNTLMRDEEIERLTRDKLMGLDRDVGEFIVA
jgi:hypothetical protein